MKKSLALLLAVLLCLTGCSMNLGKGQKTNDNGTPGYYRIADEETTCELVYPENRLNAADIYANLTYTPQMFYGDYELDKTKEDQIKAVSETGTITVTYYSLYATETKELYAMPYNITAGAGTLFHTLPTAAPEHHWMRMMFYVAGTEYMTEVMGAYEVEGTQLCFWPMTEYEYDADTAALEYKLGDTPLVYDFSFKGPQLTLSTGGKSITLNNWRTLTVDNLSGGKKYPALFADCYLTAGSPRFANLEEISLLSDSKNPEYNRLYLAEADGAQHYSHSTVAKLDDDGLLTVCWVDENGQTHSHQAVAFWCYNDGLVLCDGTATYYYNDSFWVHYESLLGGNLSEEDKDKLEDLGESAVEELEDKRTSLFDDLSAAFDAAGLDVTVDRTTGEIMLDSAVLFGVDESELTAEGQGFLQKFLKVYADVTLSDTYDGFVSKVLVEGHTDTQGDYDYNLTLSQARADAVLSWCLNDPSGAQLADLLEAVGYSYDKPIYGADGEVDMEASRRVSFRFLISIG